MFEKAKWIAKAPFPGWEFPQNEEFLRSPYFAKSFCVKGPLKKATLHAVGYGQAVYFFNGQRVKDCYLPTQKTKPTVTVVYNTYDVTEQLCTGKNRFGIVLGNDSYPYEADSRSYVRAIAQLDLEYADGSTEQICTNPSFRVADAPILHSRRLCGEIYDAREEILGWCDADFDDSDWQNAVIVTPPGGAYREVLCPPIRAIKEIAGKEIAKGLFDFGENTSGWVRLTVRAKEGEEIVIRYAERLMPDGQNINREGICNAGDPSHTERYIAKQCDKEQVWEQLTLYHGFQYAQVYGNYESVSLTAVVAYTDLPYASAFTCDDPVICAIHDACLRSILTNCHGLLTDCPHREQGRWTGDACASAEATNLNFDAYGMFYEWMHHYKDDQTPGGRICSYIPSDGAWTYNFACGVDWDSAMIHIPYYTYRYSGDRRVVDLVWDNMCRSLQYFEAEGEDYLVSFVLGDWSGISADGNGTNHSRLPNAMVGTAFFHWDAKMMVEMAEATGRDSAPFLALAKKIKEAYRKAFLKDGVVQSPHDSAIGLTAAAGLYEGEEEAKEAARLAKMISDAGNRIFCGIHGARTIFPLLSRYGYDEIAYRTVVNQQYPGYASVYVHGRTTLAEKLNFYEHEKSTGHFTSLNHHFFSSIEAWFYQALLGVRLEGFGFDHVVIEPKFVSGIHTLSGHCHGIAVSYDAQNLCIDSPHPFTLIYQGKKTTYFAGAYTFPR